MLELKNEDIIAIDNILRTCGTTAMSDKEIRWLGHTKATVSDISDQYLIAQRVITQRQKYQLCDYGVAERIVELAKANNVTLIEQESEKPTPTIPFIGGGGFLASFEHTPSYAGDERYDGLAKDWAIGPNGDPTLAAPSDTNNSHFYSEQSKIAASNADLSDKGAAFSAAEAKKSETASEQNKNESEQNKNASATSAGESKSSADASKLSEDNSKQSENNSATSERNSAASEKASSDSAKAAKTSETESEKNKNASATSAQNSEQSNQAAKISADKAAEEAGKAAAANIVMGAAEREALLAQNKEKYAASGMINTGKHGDDPINEGLYTDTSEPNVLKIGGGDKGTSKSKNANFNIAGVDCEISVNDILLPPEPDGTVIYDSTGDARGTGGYNLNLLTEADPKYGDIPSGPNAKNEARARAFEGVVKNGDFRLGDNGDWDVTGTGTLNYWEINSGDAICNIGSNSEGDRRLGQEAVITNAGDDYILSWYADGSMLDGAWRVIINGSNGFEIDGYNPYSGNETSMVKGLNRRVVRSVSGGSSVAFVVVDGNVDVSGGKTQLIISNISVRPATEEVVVDRDDMYTIEQFDMVVKDDEVFDMVQSQSDVFGDTDVPTVDSIRPSSFFAVYDGQTGITKGKCVKWSTLTDTQKRKVASYMKERLWVNEDGDLTFTTIRQRSFAGFGNGNWQSINSAVNGYLAFALSGHDQRRAVQPQGINDTPPTSNNPRYGNDDRTRNMQGVYAGHDNGFPSNRYAYQGRCFLYVLGTVSRLNAGAKAKGVNEAGGMAFSDGKKWFETTDSYATQLECFQNANATLSGRDDGRLPQYVYADGLGGVVDYRYSAYPMSSPEEAAKVSAKDDYRGLELVGKVSVSGNFEYQYTETTGGKVTLPRECLSPTVTCTHSSDGGTSWNQTKPNVNQTDNTVTLPAGGESIVTFAAFAKQTKPSTNKKVLNATSGLLGIVTTQDHNKSTFAEAVAGIILKSDVSGIVTEKSNPVKFMVDETISRIKTLASDLVAPGNSSQAVKVAIYQISDNGQCKLGFIANTMSHNGTSWGELDEMYIPPGSSGAFPDANGVTQAAMITESAISYGWTSNHARAGVQIPGVDL